MRGCLCTQCRRPAEPHVEIPYFVPVPDGDDPSVTITYTSTTDHKSNKVTRSLPVVFSKNELINRLRRAHAAGCPAHAIMNLTLILERNR